MLDANPQPSNGPLLYEQSLRAWSRKRAMTAFQGQDSHTTVIVALQHGQRHTRPR